MFEKSSVFVLVNENDKVGVRLLEVDAETNKGICSTFSDGVDSLKGKEAVEFDGKYKPNDDELLTINEFILQDSIFDAIRNPLGILNLEYSSADEPDIRAIFVGERKEENGSEHFSIAFQRFRKEQYLSTKRYSLFLDGDTFITEKRWGIGVGYNVDCLFETSRLSFESYYFARQIFDLSQYYRTATDSEIESFSSLDVLNFEDADKFAGMSDTWVRRKVASINDSEVLKNYDAKTIQKLARTIGFEIELVEDKIRVPNDKKHLKDILSFLDEEVYKGAFSEETFITNSKRKVK